MRHRNAKGFTMIELALTIILCGIVTGGILSNMDLDAAAIDRAAYRVESDLRYAQQLAQTEQLNCGLMTANAQTYQVYRQAPGNLATDPHTRLGMNVDLAINYKNVTFGAGYQVEFDAAGRPVLGGGIPIVLQNGNRIRTITVFANTGNIQVQ